MLHTCITMPVIRKTDDCQGLVRMRLNWNPHMLVAGKQDGLAIFENSLVFERAKHKPGNSACHSRESTEMESV